MPWKWGKLWSDHEPEPAEGERFDLYDLEIDEVSFVDSGDNPGSKVVMFKGRGGAGVEGVEGEKLDKHTAEAVALQVLEDEGLEGLAKLWGMEYHEPPTPAAREELMTRTMTKRADVLEEVERRAVEVRKQNDTLTPAQARVEIWLENEDLRRRYQELPPDVPVAASAPPPPVVKGAGALAKHAAAVAELRKSHPELSDSQARMRAWNDNPELAAEYQREAFE
jgi:hypothetical protein